MSQTIQQEQQYEQPQEGEENINGECNTIASSLGQYQTTESLVVVDENNQSTLSMETMNVATECQPAESPCSMITNVTSGSESSTASMDEEETSMIETVPTPTTSHDGNTSLFEPIESSSPNKRVREEQDDENDCVNAEEETAQIEATQEVTEEEQSESSALEEPQSKKVKPNEELSMISDTATDGSVNDTSITTVCCDEEDDAEFTLLYEDRERALSFYKTVFDAEVVEGESVNSSVVNSQSEQAEEICEPDIKIKGFKLNAKLSPKKKVQPLPTTPRIFVPSAKLQTTLDRIKGFEGACVEMNLDFTSITCPEGNKFTLVKIDV